MTIREERHQYIVLFRGDDSDFTGNQRILLVIQTELDLTGCKAHFRFLDFKQDFNEIPASKKLELVFPKSQTAKFPLGAMDAELWLEDSEGKRRTVSNRIHIVVTNSVPEAYNNEDTQAITVTITSGSGGGGIDPTKILEGVTMETNTLVKIREAIQTIGTALGATVTALAMILLPCRAATNTVVQTVDLRNVDLDSPVEIVTNVDCEALVDTNQLHIAITNLEEKIAQATPENYSVVSNAAMNALSRAEAEAGFTQWKLSGLPDGATEIVGPDFVESVQQPLYSLFFTYNEVVYEGWTDVSGEDVTSVVFDCADVDDTVPHITVTATRTRLPTMADIPTKTSQLTNDGAPNGGGTPYASTADATLTPIYSTTPTYGDEWICNPADFNGDPITIVWDSEENGWRPMANGSACGRDTGSSDSTSLTWTTQLDWLGDENLTATRVRTDIVGYTLGSQTNKPLQAAGDYAQASVLADVAETATNALETADAAAAAGSTNSANIATLNAQVASIAQSATNYTDSAIASADTSYARFVTLTNVNQSVQFVTLSENDTTLSIELPETGETKDWIVYVLAATNTVLSLPPATWYMTDTANTNAIPAGMTAFYFSQMATGIYMLGRQELEPVTIQGN